MATGLRIGINGTGELSSVDRAVEVARRAEADGFDTYWAAQIFGLDALTTLALVGREVPRIELGTAVVPTFPRHPMALAGQALTTQLASGDRLALGIGLSHRIVVEDLWGYSYDHPVRHMREYLDALLPLLRGEPVDVHGEDVTCVGAVDIQGAAAPPTLVAALGAQMLRLAGSRGCGTITWCTGERTLAEHIVPRITAAADEARHARPRVVASLPVAVTDDVDAARAVVADQLALYGGLPSYRAMLDLEGADGPADVALLGDEATIEAALGRLADGGVTDFAAAITAGSREEHDRTWSLLRQLQG